MHWSNLSPPSWRREAANIMRLWLLDVHEICCHWTEKDWKGSVLPSETQALIYVQVLTVYNFCQFGTRSHFRILKRFGCNILKCEYTFYLRNNLPRPADNQGSTLTSESIRWSLRGENSSTFAKNVLHLSSIRDRLPPVHKTTILKRGFVVFCIDLFCFRWYRARQSGRR